jgi:hypothetical protein
MADLREVRALLEWRRGQKQAAAQEEKEPLRKIAQELEKPTPNYGRVDKWRKDVAAFEREIAKVERRLPRRRRRRR